MGKKPWVERFTRGAMDLVPQMGGQPAARVGRRPASNVALEERAPTTLSTLFLERVRKSPRALAYRYPNGESSYAELDWESARDRVRAIATGLRILGLASEEPCALVSGTRIEWILADLAILCAGGATTAIYPSAPATDCLYILKDAACGVAFVENAEQLGKLRPHRDELPALRRIVLIEGESSGDDFVISLAELESLGRGHHLARPEEFERVARSVTPRQLATLVYTSGTTGRPKGVRLCHDGWLYQSEVGEELGLFTAQDHQYLWLPLAYVFGRVLELCAIRAGSVTTVDGRVNALLPNLASVKPSTFGAPPRIFEKIHAQVTSAAEQAGPLQHALFRWACRVGRAVSELERRGEAPTALLRFQHRLADRAVFHKVRAVFGGRMRYAFSGGAQLRAEVAEFFHAAGLPILEGYGQTECSAGAVLNRLDALALGSVGKPNPGTELRLADDGEILLKSRGVMLGYHRLPDETRAALTPDGWLKTGDLGELDARGFLRLTDRKQDIIKLSSGLRIAPQKLENALRAESPCVAFAVVHGEHRSHLSALIVLDTEAVLAWGKAERLGLDATTLAEHPAVGALVQAAVARVNARHARHESIRKFAFVAPSLGVDGGLVTASMKLRRRAFEDRHRALLEGLYEPASGTQPTLPQWIPLPGSAVP